MIPVAEAFTNPHVQQFLNVLLSSLLQKVRLRPRTSTLEEFVFIPNSTRVRNLSTPGI